MKILFLAALLVSTSAYAETRLSGDHTYSIDADFDEADTATVKRIFGVENNPGELQLYWENEPAITTRVLCGARRGCWTEIHSGQDEEGPHVIDWHFEWRGPFVAAAEFLDNSQRKEASELYALMGEESFPGYEVKTLETQGCKVRTKEFVSSDSRALIHCRKQECQETKSYCLISQASDPARLVRAPEGVVTRIRPGVTTGRTPLRVPPLKIYREGELEFTGLRGEGWDGERTPICQKDGPGWRLPRQLELRALVATRIPAIPEAEFGKKYASYASVDDRGYTVYINAQTGVEHINVVAEYAPVICVRAAR
jgi:hypothetical protein